MALVGDSSSPTAPSATSSVSPSVTGCVSRTALDGLTTRPPTGDIKKRQGAPDELRLRVGDYRVRFRLRTDGQTVEVLRVLPRGRAYRD